MGRYQTMTSWSVVKRTPLLPAIVVMTVVLSIYFERSFLGYFDAVSVDPKDDVKLAIRDKAVSVDVDNSNNSGGGGGDDDITASSATSISSLLPTVSMPEKPKTSDAEAVGADAAYTLAPTAAPTAASKFPSNATTKTTTAFGAAPSLSPVAERNQTYRHDFTYDRERWYQTGGPRIVILAGPHKTASTTIQEFVVGIAGRTVSLTDTVYDKTNESSKNVFLEPHPSNTEWVWPIPVRDEVHFKAETPVVPGGFRMLRKPSKFYATLASFVSGRRIQQYFPSDNRIRQSQSERQKLRTERAFWFRWFFQQPWEEGKKIVIGAEAFDSAVMGLAGTSKRSDEGEDTHVSPGSKQMIEALVGVFPWDNDKNSTTSAKGPSPVAPLRPEDIEVHVNYRTPRIDHVASIWHQLGGKGDLRGFVQKMGGTGRTRDGAPNLYQTNSLAVALQFVRRGIKTTLVDMAGVLEKEQHETENKSSAAATAAADDGASDETIIGGLRGVIACDIFRMGMDRGLCDNQSRLHLDGLDEPVKDQNRIPDKNDRDLTDEQLQAINKVFEEYDCGVWQHLKKYQASGTLRILYPSRRLFENCNPEGSRDISFREALETAAQVASVDNGIPERPPPQNDPWKKKRNEERKKRVTTKQTKQSKNVDSDVEHR